MIGWFEVMQAGAMVVSGIAAAYLTLVFFRIRAHLEVYRAWLRANDYVTEVRWEDRVVPMAIVGGVVAFLAMPLVPRLLGW